MCSQKGSCRYLTVPCPHCAVCPLLVPTWAQPLPPPGAHLSHCPVEVVGFPKVGQVNFLMRADLLVTMDIAQLYTNKPPQRTSLLLPSFPPLFFFFLSRFPGMGQDVPKGWSGDGRARMDRGNLG